MVEKYYNTYFGITVAVPEEYSIDAVIEDNLSKTAADTISTTGYFMEHDAWGNGYYDFILLSVTSDAYDDGYAQLYLSGDGKKPYETLEAFIEHITEMETANEEITAQVEDYGIVNHNGKDFRKVTFFAAAEEAGKAVTYCDTYYFCELPDIYLYIYLFSWDNDEGKQNAAGLLDCVTIK